MTGRGDLAAPLLSPAASLPPAPGPGRARRKLLVHLGVSSVLEGFCESRDVGEEAPVRFQTQPFCREPRVRESAGRSTGVREALSLTAVFPGGAGSCPPRPEQPWRIVGIFFHGLHWFFFCFSLLN